MRVALVALLGLGAVALTACGDDDAAGSDNLPGATMVTVALTDDGCEPDPASVAAGPVTFDVSNEDASKVTEAELMEGDRILAERENLTPGLSGKFSLRLDEGKYTMYCPGAADERSDFTVTAAENGALAQADPHHSAAVTAYQHYVEDQVGRLVPATEKFAARVKAGDAEKAKALYAPARSYYERVEPVAESFGDLDPIIDARINDVPDPAQWTGFHRLEKALWQDESLAGMDRYADGLVSDVQKLQQRITTVELQPAQVANGAVELLGEVAKSKITGEEERYSHTDLWDMDANVAGAKQAFEVLKPVLGRENSDLSVTIGRQFDELLQTMKTYRAGDGWVDYRELTAQDKRELSTKVNALAESLSKVAPVVA